MRWVRNSRHCGLVAIAVVVVFAACTEVDDGEATLDVSAIEEELKQTDREFAAATATHRLDGWMSFFAEDAARFQLGGKASRGLASIRAADSALFSDPTLNLLWDPTEAGVFKNGEHGFTTGRYQLTRTIAEDTDTLSTGGYVSIWRRENGAWRVILDTGAADSDG